MKVVIECATLRIRNGNETVFYTKGTVFDDTVSDIPKGILKEVDAKSSSVSVIAEPAKVKKVVQSPSEPAETEKTAETADENSENAEKKPKEKVPAEPAKKVSLKKKK